MKCLAFFAPIKSPAYNLGAMGIYLFLLKGHQIAESKSLNDHTEEGIPFPQWDRVKRKYYKLSKGIKTRVDAVEEVLLDEERADLR